MKKEINVVGVALIQGNKVLAARRALGRTLQHCFEFPGGKINETETSKEALLREIREEFNDEVSLGEPVMEMVSFEYDFEIVNLTVYYGKLLTNNFDLVAHDLVCWQEQSALKDLNWAPADLPIVDKLMTADLTKLKFSDK